MTGPRPRSLRVLAWPAVVCLDTGLTLVYLLHWKPLANGYSGYWPESHARLAARIHFLPDADGLDLLREYWISHLVVHARGVGRQQALREWEERFAGREVERVYRSGRTSVYRLLDPDRSRNPKRAGR